MFYCTKTLSLDLYTSVEFVIHCTVIDWNFNPPPMQFKNVQCIWLRLFDTLANYGINILNELFMDRWNDYDKNRSCNLFACTRYAPGGTHILRYTGMCRSNRSLFHKKSLNMRPIFYKNILKHGSVFQTFQNIWVFAMQTMKNGPLFWENSLKMGAFYCQNDPQTCVRVSRLERETKNLSTRARY